MLFLSLLFFATGIVSAVVTLNRMGGVASRGHACAELVAHSHKECAVPPIWSRVAIEVSTPWSQTGTDMSKSLLRPQWAHHCGRLSPQVEESADRALLSVNRGPRSSDYYVVAYRKIVI